MSLLIIKPKSPGTWQQTKRFCRVFYECPGNFNVISRGPAPHTLVCLVVCGDTAGAFCASVGKLVCLFMWNYNKNVYDRPVGSAAAAAACLTFC